MKKEDLVYAAGFFDGEGCVSIGISRYENHFRYYLEMRIGQAARDREICSWFKSKFGGIVVVNETKLNKKLKNEFEYDWRWGCGGGQIGLLFLKQLYPYLKLKKEQANLGIEFQEILSSYRGRPRLLEFEKIEKYSYYEAAKQEMHYLNRVFKRKY